jgi:hypothetical protein
MSPDDTSKKKYYPIEEIEEILGKSRATIYNCMKLLNLKTYKFQLDRKAYVAADDVESIRKVFSEHWIVQGENKKEDSSDAA